MGLELQVRGVTSAMPMNCAAAVTMAAGALQPACGCLISLILQHGTALCEMLLPGLGSSACACQSQASEMAPPSACPSPYISGGVRGERHSIPMLLSIWPGLRCSLGGREGVGPSRAISASKRASKARPDREQH